MKIFRVFDLIIIIFINIFIVIAFAGIKWVWFENTWQFLLPAFVLYLIIIGTLKFFVFLNKLINYEKLNTVSIINIFHILDLILLIFLMFFSQ